MRFSFRHPRTGTVFVELEGFSPDDYTTGLIEQTNTFYEYDVLRYIDHIAGACRLDDVFVDVGSHIGNHAVFFGRFLASHVLCVEANPAVLPTLRHNLAANIENYTVFACAAGEHAGAGTISYPDENIGMARVATAGAPTQAGPTVTVRSLDAIVAEADVMRDAPHRISAIKVDVEGMEADVLRGSLATLRDHRPHLFLEAMGEEDRRRLDAILHPLGFRAIAHLGHTPVYHYVHRPSATLRARARLYLARLGLRRGASRLRRGWRRLVVDRGQDVR
jgi:FkbM family methyltransferase